MDQGRHSSFYHENICRTLHISRNNCGCDAAGRSDQLRISGARAVRKGGIAASDPPACLANSSIRPLPGCAPCREAGIRAILQYKACKESPLRILDDVMLLSLASLR